MTTIKLPDYLRPRKLKDELGIYSHRQNGSTVLAFGDDFEGDYLVYYWNVRLSPMDEWESFGTGRKLSLARFHELHHKLEEPERA